jgi:hypothetical protein
MSTQIARNKINAFRQQPADPAASSSQTNPPARIDPRVLGLFDDLCNEIDALESRLSQLERSHQPGIIRHNK